MGGLRGEGGERIFGWGDWGGTRTEVPPTLDQPASQQGEEGRLKNLTGGVRAEMEERWTGQEFLGHQGK